MKKLLCTLMAATLVFAVAHAQQASPDASKTFAGRWNLAARNGPSATLELAFDGLAAHGTFVVNHQSVAIVGHMSSETLALVPRSQTQTDEWQTTWDVRMGADGVMHAKESACADTSNGYMCKVVEFTGQRAK